MTNEGMDFHMCIRPGNDVVSNVIRKYGVWKDCLPLLSLWKSSSFDLFIDAGANIGSCSLIMGYHKIPTVAFEPNPLNLFYLNESLKRNSFPVTVYGNGLGSSSEDMPIYMQPRNAGNSVLRVAVHSNKVPSSIVKVRRLDDIVKTGSSILLKMDVQGFEEELLKGATNLLNNRAIKTIKFEVAPDWLFAQNSSPQKLYKKLVSHGFKITKDEEGRNVFTEKQFAHLSGVCDAYAFLL